MITLIYTVTGIQFFQCMLIYHFSHFTLISQYKPFLACNTVTETIISSNTSITIGLKIFLLSLFTMSWFKDTSLNLHCITCIQNCCLWKEDRVCLCHHSSQVSPWNVLSQLKTPPFPTLLRSWVTPSTCEPEKCVLQP